MMLPEARIVERGDGSLTLALIVPSSLDAFAGHFPGHPILPGVVQVDWAMRFARRHLIADEAEARDIRIKFRSIIVPDKPLNLTLRYDGDKKRLRFCYCAGQTEMSSGQIRLE